MVWSVNKAISFSSDRYSFYPACVVVDDAGLAKKKTQFGSKTVTCFFFKSICLQISVDRGMPWEEAYSKSLNLSGSDEGFYLSLKVRPEDPWTLLKPGFGLELN